MRRKPEDGRPRPSLGRPDSCAVNPCQTSASILLGLLNSPLRELGDGKRCATVFLVCDCDACHWV